MFDLIEIVLVFFIANFEYISSICFGVSNGWPEK